VGQGVLVVVGGLGLAYGLGATAIARGPGVTTSYAAHSGAMASGFALAGLGLIAAGLVTAERRLLVGVLATVAGLLWFAPLWEGWSAGPEFVRSVGMLAVSLVFPVMVHLVVAAAGRPQSTVATALVAATYGLIGVCAVVVVLVRDPYLDPYCWTNCTANVFDVTSQPELARRVARVQSWATTFAAVALTVWCVVKLRSALRAGPRRYWEVLPGGVVFGIATVVYTVLWRREPQEDPSDTAYAVTFAIRCIAAMLIAVGLGVALLQVRWQRRSLSRIVAALDEVPAPGALDAALAEAVGDRTLRIAYSLPGSDRYADAKGREVPMPSAATATPLVRHGRTIAVISHHSDPAALERSLGSAARLALDNERLQADVKARMIDLAASRSRIVEAADARRRGLERDLHDGAQQSLLSLSYDLQVARSAAAAHGDDQLVAVLDAAIVDVREAFGELREIAHGIFPAALTATGLGPAIKSLADSYHESTDLEVTVECSLHERHPVALETAAYVVVASSLTEAAQSGARSAMVRIGRIDSMVHVDVGHDGERPFPTMVDIADRVGATGGRFVVDGCRISAEIPCGS
jgi:signal transduction histidine kinase